jgi:hypothetical protein
LLDAVVTERGLRQCHPFTFDSTFDNRTHT